MIQARVLLTLTLQCIAISHGTSSRQGLTIHQRDHTVDMDAVSDLRPIKGLQQRPGQRQTTGLDNDAVQLISPFQQALHRRKEVVLHGAAEAAVVELHQTTLHLVLRAEAATADQITIEPDTAELIHHHRKPLTALGEQVPQNSGFTGSKKTGDNGDRQALGHGSQGRQPRLSRVETPVMALMPSARAQRARC